MREIGRDVDAGKQILEEKIKNGRCTHLKRYVPPTAGKLNKRGVAMLTEI